MNSLSLWFFGVLFGMVLVRSVYKKTGNFTLGVTIGAISCIIWIILLRLSNRSTSA